MSESRYFEAKAGEPLKAGDLVTLKDCPSGRRWWQFWRPRFETRAVKVTSVGERIDGVWQRGK